MTEGRIARFTVSARAAADPGQQYLCLAVGEMIGRALCETRGGYAGSELPPLAEHFNDLWTYYGEWQNGGHAQYYGNIPDPAAWARASDLLGLMRLGEYRALLDDFILLAATNDELLLELYEAEEADRANAMFFPLDDRFFAVERRCGALGEHLHGWLLQQPWVRIDPGLAEGADLGALNVPPHPEREARRAANLRRRHAESHGETRRFLDYLRTRLIGGGRT